jgi:histidine kinase
LIDDVLMAAKMDSGGLELRLQTFDVAALATDTAALYESLFQEKGLGLKVAASGPQKVRADRDRCGQVLNNLLMNALKYTSQGGAEVRVETEGSRVNISVVDTGSGIAEESLSHLFERFYRARATASKTSGTGLGLFISKKLVEANGGEMGYRPSAGGGSVFWFSLPKAG